MKAREIAYILNLLERNSTAAQAEVNQARKQVDEEREAGKVSGEASKQLHDAFDAKVAAQGALDGFCSVDWRC